ncbi:MAG TPA: hypothetical protein ENN51_03680 [candidate division WOR-3 bacterium]|uniref:V-type proton ATPase subunit E n=1 Tax=candidate division WOR-3 bacterium TaxID=2052148 RepID=A0A7V0T5R6_UNCW3|nr:hypothetical protein [candidate division WOR-3 bacterium]
MGATELLERIRYDGRERLRSVEAGRDEELAGIAARREAEKTRLESEFKERREREVARILERARSRARLDRRKAVLAAQWRVIDRVFARARELLPADPDYPNLLKELAGRYGGDGVVVRLSPADTDRHGGRLGVKLGEPTDIAGGLLAESGRKVVDCSLDEALDAMRGQLAPLLAADLFGRSASE